MLSSLPLVLWILIFSLIGSVGSLIGSMILLWRERWTQRVMFCLISYATGTLLGAVFLGMLPKAMTSYCLFQDDALETKIS